MSKQFSVLEAKNVHKTFVQAGNKIHVLQGITKKFEQGQSYAITGASGSGKSTLLHVLGGLDTPTKGAVFFNDNELTKLRDDKKEKLLNSSLGFVFQFHYLINELTVLENIMLMGLIDKKPHEECMEQAKKLLEHVGLTNKADSHPYKLSGGEQQRVSILRALFNKPDFLLADEPTGNLDAQNAKQIIDFFLQCQQEWNLGIILCSHDQAVTQRMNHIFSLEQGRLSQKKHE